MLVKKRVKKKLNQIPTTPKPTLDPGLRQARQQMQQDIKRMIEAQKGKWND